MVYVLYKVTVGLTFENLCLGQDAEQQLFEALHRRLPDAFDHHHALRAVRAAQRFDVAVHTATEFCKVIYLVQLT